jgi:hypothetical protein
VDGLWRLCCGVAVEGPFAGGRPSVFQRMLNHQQKIHELETSQENLNSKMTEMKNQMQQSTGSYSRVASPRIITFPTLSVSLDTKN